MDSLVPNGRKIVNNKQYSYLEISFYIFVLN